MYTTTTITKRRISLVAFAIAASLRSVDAGIVTMGLRQANEDLSVDMESILPTWERTRKLQQEDMQSLIASEVSEDEDEFDRTQDVNEFLAVQEGIVEAGNQQQEFIEIASNATDDGVDFFEVNEESELGEAEQNPPQQPVVVEEGTLVLDGDVESTSDVVIGTVSTGPRGDRADQAPQVDPTEISFMIVMDEFRYSKGVGAVEDITIGTKLGFQGRIVTKAEELGTASGTCTVTSDIKKELSYCEIYHKIDTDNFGGHGSVMVAGTADEVGGRFLVTGTGGSLQSTNSGYALVQFDPAGNAVLYVLVKLF